MVIRGREFSDSDIELIRKTISENPQITRRKLSIIISQHLNWRQPNGQLKDCACRYVLLRLHKKGLINLPHPGGHFKPQSVPIKQVSFIEPTTEITGTINDFDTPVFKIVANAEQRNLWNYLVEKYHYKGCRVVVGRQLKYLIYLKQQVIGCLAFADAVLQLKLRDQWIGWNLQQRQAGLHLIINNVRFLILPWVKIKNLASKLLATSTRIVSQDWQKFYHFCPLLIETFVEKQRFTGASYKAANWVYLGQTHGKGRCDMNYYQHGIIKDVYVYPLVKISLLKRTLMEMP